MTDEQIGRTWCQANGKRPCQSESGSFRWRRHHWTATEAFTLNEILPINFGQGYDTEADAYAAVGRAMVELWQFADQSRREVQS